MRHNKKFNHLGRKTAHRSAMLSNMATSLIMHKRITTTLAKARALRTYVEPMITRSKDDTTHSRRLVFSKLQSKEAVTELFQNVSTKVADRPGGYTRILKLGHRRGDDAMMCLIELVDYNEDRLVTKSDAKAPRTRRSRRKKTDAPAAAAKSVASEEVNKPAPEAEKVADKVAAEKIEEAKNTEAPEAK